MKELLYWPENDIRPVGGPRGYLYNLRVGLERFEHKNLEVSYLPPSTMENSSIRKLLRDWTPARFKNLKRLHKMMGYPTKAVTPRINFDEFDVIHFHQVEDLFFVREALESYRGKVILTSHTPCAPQREWLSRLDVRDVATHRGALQQLDDVVEFAFDRADCIMFPCPEAEDPYYHTWDEYSSIHDRNILKYRYIYTGIDGCVAKLSCSEVREKYGIPEEDFVISYAGRHNPIKGYDRLVEASSSLLLDSHTHVMVAGRPGAIPSPRNARWVEIGWTNDPYSIIAASDVFVLPNRETYFDLAMLEALSLGVPVVATNTGGNKVFSHLGSNGVLLVNEEEELADAIGGLRGKSNSARRYLGELNRSIYEKYFTTDVFARNYVNLIESMLISK